jgi:hypothetical protein
MGVVKNFINELAKHKMLVYFVTLWGAWLFLWTVYGFIEWGFHTDLLGIIDLFFHLSELFAGLLLVIIGIKLMDIQFLSGVQKFLEGFKNDQLLIYFLLLWAASFVFGGLYVVIDHGPYIIEYWECFIAFLAGLAMLFAGVTLGLFSWNLLNEPEQETA